jgi:transposase
MIYVGIDISKYKHDCFIATKNSIQFSFENNQQGFKTLLDHFQSFQKQDMIIGLEATGHYGDNLKSFLTSHGYTFMEINPFLVKKFSDSKSLRKLKTDKKDAKLIAEFMTTVDYKAYHHQSYHISALKSLTRWRFKLISFRTSQYNMMTKTLDIIFPEFKPFMNEQGYSDTSLYILKRFTTPSKIAKLKDSHYDALRKRSMGKFSYPKFSKLRLLAAETVGVPQKFQIDKLKSLITYVEKLNEDIKHIESEITWVMKHYPTHFQTIKGIGIITAAIILAEYGEISLFDKSSQMVSYAGLDASIHQSGTISTTGRLVKRGSKFLRAALINASMTVMIHNPVFYRYYETKKQQGKHHRVALVHLTKKLIRVIHHLEMNKTTFDSKQLN